MGDENKGVYVGGAYFGPEGGDESKGGLQSMDDWYAEQQQQPEIGDSVSVSPSGDAGAGQPRGLERYIHPHGDTVVQQGTGLEKYLDPTHGDFSGQNWGNVAQAAGDAGHALEATSGTQNSAQPVNTSEKRMYQIDPVTGRLRLNHENPTIGVWQARRNGDLSDEQALTLIKQLKPQSTDAVDNKVGGFKDFIGRVGVKDSQVLNTAGQAWAHLLGAKKAEKYFKDSNAILDQAYEGSLPGDINIINPVRNNTVGGFTGDALGTALGYSPAMALSGPVGTVVGDLVEGTSIARLAPQIAQQIPGAALSASSKYGDEYNRLIKLGQSENEASKEATRVGLNELPGTMLPGIASKLLPEKQTYLGPAVEYLAGKGTDALKDPEHATLVPSAGDISNLLQSQIGNGMEYKNADLPKMGPREPGFLDGKAAFEYGRGLMGNTAKIQEIRDARNRLGQAAKITAPFRPEMSAFHQLRAMHLDNVLAGTNPEHPGTGLWDLRGE